MEKVLPHKLFKKKKKMDFLITDDVLYCFQTDVMDVAWSPHDAWLASCSVDNTVVIWNAVKFPGEKSYISDMWVCNALE